MDAVRLLIADDHPLFRDGLRAVLDSVEDIDVVGEAASGTEAIERADALQPDVIVMDINMPGVNGVEATGRIVARSPHIGVLVLTMFEDDDSVFAALRAGARGYLLKGASADEVMLAIRAVGHGEAVFGPSIAKRITAFLSSPPDGGRSQVFPELTEREREILDLIAGGMSNPAIATRLFLSQKTVRNHVSNIFAKLQVADRADAIIRARDAGLGKRA